jgi:hypothetical protein
MKLVSVTTARSIWLVPVDEINPRGKYLSNAVQLLIKKYSFAKVPTIEELVTGPAEGLKFQEGAYTNRNGEQIYISFTVHRDGVVIDSRSSTDDNDLFMSEVLNLLSKTYDLPSQSELSIRRLYSSIIYIESDRSLKIISPKLIEFCQSISSMFNAISHHNVSFELSGLIFGSDPATTSRLTPAPFRFERAEGVPFEQNRYFSSAPVPTETHLKLLSQLENLLADE